MCKVLIKKTCSTEALLYSLRSFNYSESVVFISSYCKVLFSPAYFAILFIMSQPKLTIRIPQRRLAAWKLQNDLVSNETNGLLVLGSSLLDIRKGLEIVARRLNCVVTRSRNNNIHVAKYTVLLYINHGFYNQAVQFIEIESNLLKSEIIDLFFTHLEYKLPRGRKISKEKKDKLKYFGQHDDFNLLEISRDQAYVYIGDYDGRSYKNHIVDAVDFVYRHDIMNKPSMCSIM